ncbi:MAG: Crp/Fnr family transcriptional regulator [Microscillaceae bacterium]
MLQLNTFINLTPSQTQEFVKFLKPEKYKRGEIVHRAGEICHKTYYIQSGILRHTFREGKRKGTVWFVFENEITTDFNSFIHQAPAKYSLIAVTEVELLSFTYADLHHLYTIDPAFERMSRHFTEYHLIRFIRRAHDLLFKSAQEKYNDFLKQHPGALQNIPLKQIAEFIGVSSETLSRVRARRD